MSEQTTMSLDEINAELARAKAEAELETAKIRLSLLERRRKAEELRTANWWPRQPNPGNAALSEAFQRKAGQMRGLLEQGKEGLTEGNFLWDWVSGYSDLIDRLRSPDGLLLSAISIAADRRYGACWPFFRTWQDLALLRGASRVLFQTSALARGVVSGLTSYVIGDGFSYRASEKDGCPLGLRQAVQDFLDEYGAVNQCPTLEAELLRRDVRDGEWFLRDFPQDNGMTLVRTVDPPQVIQPAGGSLEEWSFGVQNPTGEEHDVQTALAYNVCYDGNNTRGEIVDAGQMLHHTCNVDRDVKRGLPDLAYDTYDFLKIAGRLIENMAEGSAIQAAIAEIIQFEGPVTQDQANDFLSQDSDYQQTDPWTGGQYNTRQVRSGDRVIIPKGANYVAPPFTQGSTIFIQVEQAVLRAAAVTWNAPEWLTSGDASNNNYASSLTAESPFIKTCKRRQGEYKEKFVAARWRALRHRCEAVGFVVNGRRYGWEEVRKYVTLQCEPPSPEVRDKGDEASANNTRIQGGWKSRQTVAQEEGLDWETEVANIEEYNERMGGEAGGLPMPGQGGDLGGGGGGMLGMESVLLESWLREEGFTGVDKHGHKWVNGKQVKKGGGGGKDKPAQSPQATKAAKEIDATVTQLSRSPQGRKVLKKGKEIAAKVKDGVKTGVLKALDGLDAESGGGATALVFGLKAGDLKSTVHAAAGATRLVSTVYQCVHEEMLELLLSQSTGQPAFVAKLAAKGAARGVIAGQVALAKASAWAWAKLRGSQESAEWTLEGAMSDVEKDLLVKLSAVAAQAVRELLAGAGVEDADVDQGAVQARLAKLLGAEA